MNIKYILRLPLLLSLLLSISGCQYFSDKPLDKDIFESEALNSGCQLDANEFKQFFEKNIGAQVDCLGEKLKTFHQYVRKENVTYIKEEELQKFIIKFFPDNKEDFLNAISLIFELNSILLKDNRDQISINNIPDIVAILKVANREAVRLSPLLKQLKEKENKRTDGYWGLRQEIRTSLDSLSFDLLTIMLNKRGVASINLEKFLKDLTIKFPSVSLSSELIGHISLLKRVVIGGEREFLTNRELLDFLRILPDLALAGIDLYKLETIPFTNDDEKFAFFASRIDTFQQILIRRNAHDHLFQQEELISLVKYFAPSSFNLSQIETLLTKLKPLLLQDSSPAYTVLDLRTSFDFAKLGYFAFQMKSDLQKVFDTLTPATFERSKAITLVLAERLKRHTERLLAAKRIPLRPIAITPLVEALDQVFEFNIDKDLLDLIANFSVAFIGGEAGKLSKENIDVLASKLPQLATIGMDVVAYSKSYPFTKELSSQLDLLSSVASALKKDEPTKELVTIEHVATLLNQVFKKSGNFKEKLSELMQIKYEALGGKQNVVTTQEVEQLLHLMKFSLQGIDLWNQVSDVMKNTSEQSFINDGKVIKELLENHQEELTGIIKERALIKEDLNLSRLLTNLTKTFSDFKFSEADILTIMVAKKLLLGGSRDTLNTAEILKLVQLLPVAAKEAFYLTKAKEYKVDNLYPILADSIIRLKGLASKEQKESVLLTISELAEIADHYTDQYTFTKAIDSLSLIKRSVLSNSTSSDITVGESHDLLGLAFTGFHFVDFTSEILDETKGRSYDEEQKEAFIKSANLRSQIIKDHLSDLPASKINIYGVIEGVQTLIADASMEFEFKANIVKNMVGFKKLILGGKRDQLSSNEIGLLASKLPELVSTAYSLKTIHPMEEMESVTEYWKVMTGAVATAKDLIEPSDSSDLVISTQEVFDLLQEFFPEQNMSNYVVAAGKLKLRLLGGKEDEFSTKDLLLLLSKGEEFATRVFFSYVTFENNSTELSELKQRVEVQPLPLESYSNLIDEETRARLHKNFQRVVNNYRFFRDSYEGEQYYFYPPIRKPYGIAETVGLEYVMEEMVRCYGHKDTNNKSISPYSVSEKEVNAFLFEMKPLLEKINLWSKQIEGFARNTILLVDLFQNQSSGNYNLEAEELNEYLALIISAIRIAPKVRDHLKSYCPASINPNGEEQFDSNCYRKNYFQVLLQEVGLEKHFIALNNHINKSSDKEKRAFLLGIEGFARESKNLNDPIYYKEIILVTGALLNIESTILRFDTNENGAINTFAEVNKAFSTYQQAVTDVMAKVTCSKPNPNYARPVFLYLLKYKKPPEFMGSTTFGMALFLMKQWIFGEVKVNGDRNAIAAILTQLVKSGGTVCK